MRPPVYASGETQLVVELVYYSSILCFTHIEPQVDLYTKF